MRFSFYATLYTMLLHPVSIVHAQETTTNSIGMEFVLIHPGSMTVGEFQPPYPVPEDTVKSAKRPYIMWMGEGRGYSSEEFRRAKQLAMRDATPGFNVNIDEAFYIGKFEVTQGQWKRVMGNNPATFQDGDSDNRPVENVSWEEAKRFIQALNKLEKTKCYRLPTEFEWEYAARAGAQKDISWPDIQSMANLNKTHTLPVGKMKPNNWGLYDMLGNIWEWVEDYHNGKIFADPTPPRKGSHHVLKGASFVGDVKNATFMTHASGPGNGWDIGFRIVKMIDQR
jgi:formylglycine-generating enzyme